MSTQDEINAALDALEINDPIESDPIEEETIDEIADEVIEDELKPKENPLGYIDNLDDWIAAGKDPDLFKGKKAYSQEYERIKEIKELKASMQAVADGVSEWKEQQMEATAREVEKARKEAIAELERAKDDMDIDAALAAKEKIDGLNTQQPQQPRLNPVISDFFSKNPILDEKSAQFDAEFFDDMKLAQHTLLNQLTGGDQTLAAQLTPSQIERSLKVAYSRAKDLNPDKFVSKRNSRQAAPTVNRREPSKGGDVVTRLKTVKSDGKNKRDTKAATEIYEMLKAKDPAAAETFAKNILGE